jgi:hypothetical protein
MAIRIANCRSILFVKGKPVARNASLIGYSADCSHHTIRNPA